MNYLTLGIKDKEISDKYEKIFFNSRKKTTSFMLIILGINAYYLLIPYWITGKHSTKPIYLAIVYGIVIISGILVWKKPKLVIYII